MARSTAVVKPGDKAPSSAKGKAAGKASKAGKAQPADAEPPVEGVEASAAETPTPPAPKVDAPPAAEVSALVERSRGVPLTRGAIGELSSRPSPVLRAALGRAVEAQDVKSATALALSIAAKGEELAPELVARLIPDVDQRDLVPTLLRHCAGDRLAVMRAALEGGQVSHDREAIVAFVASQALGEPPWPAPWPGLLRTLARQKLGTEAGVLLAGVLERSKDPFLLEVGTEWIELAERSNADEIAKFWLDGWTQSVLEILPETEPPRVVAGYTVRKAAERPGRNDPCHCGSGKKYKKCHAAADEAQDRVADAPQVDTSRVSATDVEGMRIQEILALPLASLQRPALVAVSRQLRAYHRWERAEAAIDALAKAGHVESEVEELREQLVEEALRLRNLDVVDRQRGAVRDRQRIQQRHRACIGRARPSAETLRVLDDQARVGLGGDVDATADVAYSLLDHAPALGILVARGALDPARTTESDVLLDEIELARDRLGLAPGDPFGPLYDDWVGGRQAELATEGKSAAELGRLRAELERAEGEVEKRQAQAVALEHEIRELRERVERSAHREASAGMPESQAITALRATEEHRQRLSRKVDELKSLLAEGHTERASLRERVSDLETAQRELEARANEAEEDDDEGGNALDVGGPDGDTVPVRVPVFGRKALEALRELPPKTARTAVSAAGRLGAGDRAAWRDVKRMQGMEGVWTARIGIHHRLIFRVANDLLDVMDVVTREALLTSLERYR